MVLQSWVIDYLQMYKIYDEIIKFIEKKHEKLERGIDRWSKKNLAEVKIQRSIFLRDALSPLLFLLAMIPLNHILRKCTGGYSLTKS